MSVLPGEANTGPVAKLRAQALLSAIEARMNRKLTRVATHFAGTCGPLSVGWGACRVVWGLGPSDITWTSEAGSVSFGRLPLGAFDAGSRPAIAAALGQGVPAVAATGVYVMTFGLDRSVDLKPCAQAGLRYLPQAHAPVGPTAAGAS